MIMRETKTNPIDTPHVQHKTFPKRDEELFKQFIKTYDSGNLEFNTINFRKGAVITGTFGIAEGYKMINGKMEWGYVRIHQGVDRASGGLITVQGETIRDAVLSPFHFDRSWFNHYGDYSYGTLTQLFNDQYQFEMRIAHMALDDFIPWSLKQFQKRKGFGRDWVIGQAGTYGASSGEHTHTEFKSLDEECEVFEILLLNKFGEEVLKEYSSEEVINSYKKYQHFKNASNTEILSDWQEIKKVKNILFANKYLVRYIDWDGTKKTRYASNLLFNGL